LYTPAFEYLELLTKKSGEEIEKEIYSFKDKSDRNLGLRFDFTVPSARVVSSNHFKLPFKRYQIGKVWRYDRPQSGRWREFTQADVDIYGCDTIEADIECLQVVIEYMKNFDVDFKIKINNRKLVKAILNMYSMDKPEVLRAIDKKDKIGWKGVEKELKKYKEYKKALQILKKNDLNIDVKEKQELQQLLDKAKKIGILKYLEIDLSMVRGLDYYTGNIFEISAGLDVSIGGGGRYDCLLKEFGKDMPAVGISIGIDRFMLALKDIDFKKEKIYIANVSNEYTKKAVQIASKLRKKGNIVERNLMDRKLGNQLKDADSKGFTKAIIVGKETENNEVVFKDLKKEKEKKISLDELYQKY
jgi:histidyl-tRNA synthetase